MADPSPRAPALAALALLALGACTAVSRDEVMPYAEVAALPPSPPDRTVAYGPGPQQFGELRLPAGTGPFPVVVLLHGGCWLSEFDLAHVGPLSGALARAGFAVWTLEYRRVGDPGGGWPGTFEDVARGTDHLRALARTAPLDLGRVVLAGHSAGGHLALWLAGRRAHPAPDLPSSDPLPVRGVVALAAISDLAAYAALPPNSCNDAVPGLMGGTAAEVAGRYAQGSPSARLPLGVPVRLLHGARDPIVPLAQSERFADAARARGDDAVLLPFPRAGHFELVAPHAETFAAVVAAARELVADP